LKKNKSNGLSYTHDSSEGLVSIFANNSFVTELVDENANHEEVFNWFVDVYSKASAALGCTGLIEWKGAGAIPVVSKGAERLFWLAVEVASSDEPKVVTFLAHYQNRPLEQDGDGEFLNDDYLTNTDGAPIESVGWVSCKEHVEFSNFYEVIKFNDEYKLLGWAEYTPPTFTKIKV
jgi:hypothetical protein